MIDSPASVADAGVVEADVCIVGAGAAGLSIALELSRRRGLKVCLLEAGGLERGKGVEDAYVGEIVGRPYSLTGTRLRFFGGTTNHWGGWCRPLDEIDFRRRRHIPWSGWPISRESLDPFYLRAAELCEISPATFELEDLPPSPEHAAARFERFDAEFRTRLFRFSPPTRFGQRYRPNIEKSAEVICLLESTVVEIVVDGNTVERLRVRAQEKQFSVRARAFVLAMGGIENPRLLLASSRQLPAGVGNHHDMVGRFFCDHLGLTSAAVLASESVPYVRHNRSDVDVLPHLSFRDDILDREELINFGAIFATSSRESFLEPGYMDDPRLFEQQPPQGGQRLYNFIVRFEATPNPDSRVLLSRERDGNGMPRVRLDWRPNRLEAEALNRIVELVAVKLGAAGLGRMQRLIFGTPDELQRATYSAHHLGTTRMSEDSRSGVVDVDCKVHGLSNLYVAGSSVFPTAGFANPTLTITALAVRLANHLHEVLQ